MAPVRYLIRPTIETARKFPKSFATIVALTLGTAISLSVIILTGGFPIIAGGIFLAGSLALKLTTVGLISISLGAFLTKSFNTVRDLLEGLLSKEMKPREQMFAVDKRNQKTDYDINIMVTQQEITVDTLDKKDIPLLILKDNKFFIYGRSQEGGTLLTQLSNYYYFRELFEKCESDQVIKKSGPLYWEIYEDINCLKSHFPAKVGSTEKITEAFHAIDIDHTEVRAPKDQDGFYTAALFFGAESFFYAKKKPAEVAMNVADDPDIRQVSVPKISLSA